jgi:hypothetical protein
LLLFLAFALEDIACLALLYLLEAVRQQDVDLIESFLG